MDGIGTILGVIALFVALAALWFVNDVVRRIERQNQQLLETHVKAVKDAVEDCVSQIKGIEKRAAESARQVADLAQKQGEANDRLAETRAAVEKVRVDLEALDKSIPVNFRTPRSGRRGD